MRFLLFVMLFGVQSINAKAQTAEDSVKLAVNKLFNGMITGDAAMIRDAFTDSAVLQSVGREKDGKVTIENDRISDFADLISKLPKGDADERISFDVIKIDGALAIVWAPYKFYLKGVFSHCGVDSFQLVKINNLWKIQYLIDTRRRKGCE